MKIIRVHEYGEPDVMRVEHMGPPEPGAGMVRVKVEAVGVNFIDIYQRSGQYRPALPFTPGQEAAGVVDMVGAGVTSVKAGDRVAYSFTIGAYAEYTIVPAEKLVPVPDGVDSQSAAAVMLQGMTAHYLVTDTYQVKPESTILIHAAAGGTGALVVQIAKLRGARVLATVSTEAKMRIAREAGADEVFLYEDFDTEVKRLTNGHGVDVVYDSVGKDTFDRSLNCLRPRGYMVLFGQSSGAVPPFDVQLLNSKGSLFLTRPTLGNYTATPDEIQYRAGALFGLIGSGKLKVRIDRALSLEQAAEAHRALASRQTTGKVLLVV
ncbi:MAG: quinone oxidoreductase [Chloroflexi bacterium]|nr:quinone oxidoreductase [Chloroflexota bacterium]MCC6896834.1 quinone oxidoreductase [Anaerolineae bacterium]